MNIKKLTTSLSFMDRDTHEDSMKIFFVFLWPFYKILQILEVRTDFWDLTEFKNWNKNEFGFGLHPAHRPATSRPPMACQASASPRPRAVSPRRGSSLHTVPAMSTVAAARPRMWSRRRGVEPRMPQRRGGDGNSVWWRWGRGSSPKVAGSGGARPTAGVAVVVALQRGAGPTN